MQSKEINIVLFGIGNVGSTLIKQVQAAKEIFAKKNIQVNIPIIANSTTAFFAKEGVDNGWETDFSKLGVPYSVLDVVEFVNKQQLPNVVAVDATASQEVVNNYVLLIRNGFHIVTANKIANTLDIEFYTALRTALKQYNKRFFYETNVGAGLPIIETLRSLNASGEKISKVRGVVSGSLSDIFNTLSAEERPFSEVLTEASDLGYTEPDAREDLSGNDVARKLLILARELDLQKEFTDVQVDSLIPKKLNGKTTATQFKQRVKELDEPFHFEKTKLKDGQVLRYVGELSVEDETLDVKLVPESKDSPIGQLKGADSLFEIYAESYGDQPLVIQGAGAGKEVTARGIISDIVKLTDVIN